MIDILNQALDTYMTKWQELISQTSQKDFFTDLRPVAVGWKVNSRADYEKTCAQLHDRCDHMIETWMNGRWIAKLHLRGTRLHHGITIIKIMQRRPGSQDAPGLDHIDFYSPRVTEAEAVLANEKQLKWTFESNDITDDYHWISLWFDSTEAKLKSDTVLDIIIKELRDLNQTITHSS